MDKTTGKIYRPKFNGRKNEKELVKLEILNVLNECQSMKDKAAAETICDVVEKSKINKEVTAIKYFMLGCVFVGLLCFLVR